MAGHLVLLAIKYLTINSNLLALRLPLSSCAFFFPLQPEYVWSLPRTALSVSVALELSVETRGGKRCGVPGDICFPAESSTPKTRGKQSVFCFSDLVGPTFGISCVNDYTYQCTHHCKTYNMALKGNIQIRSVLYQAMGFPQSSK